MTVPTTTTTITVWLSHNDISEHRPCFVCGAQAGNFEHLYCGVFADPATNLKRYICQPCIERDDTAVMLEEQARRIAARAQHLQQIARECTFDLPSVPPWPIDGFMSTHPSIPEEDLEQ